MEWTKESIRELRLRMGWSQADFARRLNCEAKIVDLWERGLQDPVSLVVSELELLARDAEVNSTEIICQSIAENLLASQAVDQIDFSEIEKEIKE